MFRPSCVKAIDLLRVNDFKSFVVPSERKEREKENFSLEKGKLALEEDKRDGLALGGDGELEAAGRPWQR